MAGKLSDWPIDTSRSSLPSTARTDAIACRLRGLRSACTDRLTSLQGLKRSYVTGRRQERQCRVRSALQSSACMAWFGLRQPSRASTGHHCCSEHQCTAAWFKWRGMSAHWLCAFIPRQWHHAWCNQKHCSMSVSSACTHGLTCVPSSSWQWSSRSADDLRAWMIE